MNDDLDYGKYIGERVKILGVDGKSRYIADGIVGRTGIIERVSSSSFGIRVNGKTNKSSAYGIYWINKSNLKFLDDDSLNNKSEDNIMEGFKFVAIVNLVEDYNKKDYAFALYDEEFNIISNFKYAEDVMVVVNPKTKTNRMLATIKDLIPVEDYDGAKITAEVVGVVNMSTYNAREREKKRLAELEKKKAAIEKELEAEISKRKSVEYYEEMAKKYSDNPKLAELVAELKGLGV